MPDPTTSTVEEVTLSSTGPDAGSRGRLLEVIEPAVFAAGADLEDLEVTPAGRRRLLRIVVDRDGGISLDDVAAVSHAVAARLDDTDVMGTTPYVLEVTSPGVDRPLTRPRHWRRATGRLVQLVLADGRAVTGRVTGSDDHGVTLDTGTPLRLHYDEVRRAHVQVEFRRPPGEGESQREEP